MSFELLVEFAGLCLYVAHPERNKVAILMPDGRKDADPEHPDGEDGEAHVGYIRFDLANLNVSGMTLPAPGKLDDGSGSPPNEIIHRFSGQQLDFGLEPDDNPMKIDIGVPSFDEFAGSLEPVRELYTSPRPEELLMRTTISGGAFASTRQGKTWQFSSVLQANGPRPTYSGQFAGFTVWHRPVKADGLTVTISDFDGTPAVQIPLKPRDIGGKSIIAIKVANLCSNNPLEWGEYPLRTVVKHDLDFKWLYRLLRPANGDSFEKALAGAELPFPRAKPNQAFGDEDCMGGIITSTFP